MLGSTYTVGKPGYLHVRKQYYDEYNYLRRRLHVDDQSKNGEMYSDSTPSFLLHVYTAPFDCFASGSK